MVNTIHKYTMQIWWVESFCWTWAGLGRGDMETALHGGKIGVHCGEMCVF